MNMSKTGFVQFSDDDATYNNDKPFDGYLAFLPETDLSYRYFSGKDFCWFEFKDTQLTTDLSMQVTAQGSYLWLLINMRTGVSVTLDNLQLVPTDQLLCYQTQTNNHKIFLPNKSTWFMLLGIEGHMLQELTAEYTQLKSLLDTTTNNSMYHIIGTVALKVKVKRVLESLHQIKFRPFSTYYQLANWNTRFFQHVFQEIEAHSVEKTDHEIELYYKALDYIRENFYDDRTNTETVAKALYVSESTLKRSFQDKALSVTEQIIEFRLQEARELIRTSDTSISTIAASLNFACPKNFKRLFTKRFKTSPLQYRDSMQLKRLF
ncbi:helix-turn-helix transcriptional regulator [Sphingobacterium sp. SGG-5]|uniref:helix-turn-helix transcriptional regulator n=1 Tax=Sphingobacterium sp. SGG-5 TaxID=2710881 RepID=UPI0013E9ACAD|nr:AraC family transcriptional regulator [Sphingobacterium sp. SGG-5]NGM62527.1 helix-turn-helix transcriptional regulator [Sphingobacterium sp. SGG-5]